MDFNSFMDIVEAEEREALSPRRSIERKPFVCYDSGHVLTPFLVRQEKEEELIEGLGSLTEDADKRGVIKHRRFNFPCGAYVTFSGTQAVSIDTSVGTLTKVLRVLEIRMPRQHNFQHTGE